MKPGRAKEVNWKQYKTHKFVMPEETEGDFGGCGGFALNAITKAPAKEIKPGARMMNGHWHYSAYGMEKFLKSKGYKMIHVGVNTLHESQGRGGITEEHVVLVLQNSSKETNTWSVMHHGYAMHSGDIEKMNPFEFINWPVEDAFIIWHPKWASKED